jgi:predicted PP-loop superfamily ATPase
MSTQIFGDYDTVMQRLVREVRTSFVNQERSQDKAVFVLKILGPMAT